MVSSKLVDPPQDAKNQLEKLLLEKYKSFEEKFEKSVSYGLGKNSVRYTANVTYYCDKNSLVALFSYKENKDRRDFYWYCTRDWND